MHGSSLEKGSFRERCRSRFKLHPLKAWLALAETGLLGNQTGMGEGLT